MDKDQGHPDHPNAHVGETDRDVLITRAVDGRATGSDWAAMESLSAREPGFWRELALAHRDQRALERLVGVATNVAGSVNLPAAAGSTTSTNVVHHESTDREFDRQSGRSSALRIWGGWVAAAILGFAILSGKLGAPLPKAGDPNKAELIPASWSSEQVLEDALKRGRSDGKVVGEYGDPYVLATEPTADGQGYTVVYIRPILIRRQVQNVYQTQNVFDETGQVVGKKPQPLRPRAVGY